MNTPNRSGRIALLVALVALPFLLWFRNEGIPLSDESFYAHAAVQWLRSGTPTTGASIFEHRWALIYPMSVLAGWFGTSVFGLSLWSALCFFGVLLSVFFWMRAQSYPNYHWAIALLATNPAMIWSAVNISPDIVCTCFTLIAILLTLHRAQPYALSKGLLVGFAFGLAFWAKETAVFFGIPMLVFAAGDLKNQRNQRFWFGLAVGLIVFIVAYLAVYQVYTGNYLQRFEALKTNYLNRTDDPFSLAGKPWSVRLERLFVRPIPFFLKEPGYSFVCLALLLLLQKSFWKNANNTLREVAIVALSVGCYFVFGTVSLSSYTPITLADRMILPVLPYLILLVVYPNTSSHQQPTLSRLLTITLFGLSSVAIALLSQKHTLPLVLSALFAACVVVVVWRKWYSQNLLLSLVMGFQLAFLWFTPRNTEYFIERSMLKQALTDPQTQVIATDPRLAAMYRSHIEFDSLLSGKVICWDSVAHVMSKLPQGAIYVLENRQRIASPVIGNGHVPSVLQFRLGTDQIVQEQGNSRLWKRFLPVSVE